MKYNVIIDQSRHIDWLGSKVRLIVESPRVLTNTIFLEHANEVSGKPTDLLIAKQTNEILESNDFGNSWKKFGIDFSPTKCFTVSNGNHILYNSENDSLVLFSDKWELISEAPGFPHPWHGSWSIDESPDGTIIWGEYAYSDVSLSVFRSTNGGLDWDKVLTVEGGVEDPFGGKIRHFHTCTWVSSEPGKWLVSSGDTDDQCRMWSSEDDGLSWTEVIFDSDQVLGADNPRIITPKLWRRTAEFANKEFILYPTDDNHSMSGSRLLKMDLEEPQKAQIVGHLGPNEIRNFINLGDDLFVSISESKNNKNSIFVHLCHPDLGASPLIEIPNELKLKSNVCNSVSSRSAIDGVFWTFQDGIAIRKKPKILKWSISFGNNDGDSDDGDSVISGQPVPPPYSYPEPLLPKEALRDDLPFISPTDPSRRDHNIDQILEMASKDGIFELPPYDPVGGYLTLHKSNILNNKVVEFNEEDGIPVNKYSHLDEPHPYPVSIGLYALEQYSKFIMKPNGDNLSRFRSVCTWIIDNQGQEGAWPVPFVYAFFKDRGGNMPKGWVSALGQGYCISSLCRYLSFVRSNESNKDLESVISSTIERALKPFEVDVELGGIKRIFGDGNIFFEEYPTPKPSFVLNGFMFSLLGLYDAWKVIGSEDAARLYSDGIKTLTAALPFFDLGDRSAYDLTHLQKGNESMPPNPARPGYHDTHIRLLDAFNGIEDGIFADVLVRWIMYRYGVPSSNN